MKEKKRPVFTFVLILSFVLIAAGIAACIQNIFGSEATLWMRIGGIAAALALLSAGYYLLVGYSKNASRYYKVFVALFSISQLETVIGTGIGSGVPWAVICAAVALGLILAMFIGENLGKTLSITLCILNIAFCVAGIVFSASLHPGVALGGNAYGTQMALRNIEQILLSVLLLVITAAKYIDKEKRGTK